MEQQQYHNKVCLDQDMGESLSFSGLLCVQQQTKSAELNTAVKNNDYGSANSDPDFHFNSSTERHLIKPVSYNNLAVLLPRCESGSGRGTSPKRYDGGKGKKDLKGGKRAVGDVKKKKNKKKSVFISIFKPCKVCHAVEPSAIKEQNPLAARKQSSI